MDELMKLLSGQVGQIDQNQKTFSDMLKERRAFAQNSEDSMKNSATSTINNGIDGVKANPISVIAPYVDYLTTNENKSNAFVQQMQDFNTQKTGILKMLADIANASADRGLKSQELGIQNRAQNREDYLAGFAGSGDTGSGSGNGSSSTNNSPLVEQAVQNVMNGTQDLDTLNMPQALKNKVQQELTSRGYDPAKDVNTYLQQLQGSYFNNDQSGKKGSIAQGNNFGSATENTLGSVLNFITHGLIQTPREQQVKGYETLRNSLSGSLQSLLGRDRKLSPKLIQQITSSLPEVGDTEALAKSKFKKVQDLINATYYQGQQPPTNQKDDPLGLFK